jgi:YD repeat-containing protein
MQRGLNYYNMRWRHQNSSLTYRPFGGMSASNNGANGSIGSAYNSSGKLTVSNPGATHERTYGYDNNGNMTAIIAPSTPYYSRAYQYDALNRLTNATADYAWGEIEYTYDNVGNRLTQVTDDDSITYSYLTGTNLLSSVTTGPETTNYTYNGLGQRMEKVASGTTTVFHYDFDGNIIGESTASGTLSKE